MVKNRTVNIRLSAETMAELDRVKEILLTLSQKAAKGRTLSPTLVTTISWDQVTAYIAAYYLAKGPVKMAKEGSL